MPGSRSLHGAQWVRLLTHTRTTGHYGEVTVISDLQVFHLLISPSRLYSCANALFRFRVERKADPGDMDSMLALSLGSEALLFFLKEMDHFVCLKERCIQL